MKIKQYVPKQTMDQRENYLCVCFICNETNENTNIKTMGCGKSSPKRKVSNNICIYYEKLKILKKQPYFKELLVEKNRLSPKLAEGRKQQRSE